MSSADNNARFYSFEFDGKVTSVKATDSEISAMHESFLLRENFSHLKKRYGEDKLKEDDSIRSAPLKVILDGRDFEGIRSYGVQADAVRAAKLFDGKSELMLFAHDKANTDKKGAKVYYIATVDYLWDRINRQGDSSSAIPSFYLISRGFPCHGFIDAEFSRVENPNVDEEELEKSFLKDLMRFMKEMGVITKERKASMLNLESRSDEKVSHHYHFIGNNWCFKNHFHFGAFMRLFVCWTIEKYGSNLLKHPYFMWEAGTTAENTVETGCERRLKFYADMAIYTTNRVFRLAYNAKYKPNGSAPPMMTSDEWDQTSRDEVGRYVLPPKDKDNFLNSISERVDVSDFATKDNEKPFYLIHCLNPDGSEPYSTSNIRFHQNKNGSIGNNPFGSTGFVRNVDLSNPIPKICTAMIAEIVGETCECLAHNEVDAFVTVATRSKKCSIQKILKGVEEHSTNHVHFVIHYTRGYYYAKCKDDGCIAYCTEKNYWPKEDIPDKWKDYFVQYILKEDPIDDSDIVDSMNEVCRGIKELIKIDK